MDCRYISSVAMECATRHLVAEEHQSLLGSVEAASPLTETLATLVSGLESVRLKKKVFSAMIEAVSVLYNLMKENAVKMFRKGNGGPPGVRPSIARQLYIRIWVRGVSLLALVDSIVPSLPLLSHCTRPLFPLLRFPPSDRANFACWLSVRHCLKNVTAPPVL
eukprot:TRINITY_DN32561_c0_g1_i1.p1 TRINITY_DN32561_c0_g1~~TRINITY_DN32561_c0_g1_i1.p1  ORF type:complete len:163 (+),score=6.42 TRINITY_DN32561_c0_g1_i1:3-491(+)